MFAAYVRADEHTVLAIVLLCLMFRKCLMGLLCPETATKLGLDKRCLGEGFSTLSIKHLCLTLSPVLKTLTLSGE